MKHLIQIPYNNRYKQLDKAMGLVQALAMARKRTKLTLSPAEAVKLKAQIRAATDSRDRERLQVVLWATSGQHSLAALAELAGRARSTIQIWLDDFAAGGVARLLERTAPPGKPSLVAGAKVQAELKAGLQAGHWRTAGQVAAWQRGVRWGGQPRAVNLEDTQEIYRLRDLGIFTIPMLADMFGCSSATVDRALARRRDPNKLARRRLPVLGAYLSA